MKTIRVKELPDGSSEVTVRLGKGETLLPIVSGQHYQLAYPLEDFIVPAHVLDSSKPASWCCVEQKWVV